MFFLILEFDFIYLFFQMKKINTNNGMLKKILIFAVWIAIIILFCTLFCKKSVMICPSVKEYLAKCEFAMFENVVSSKCNIHKIPRRTMLMIKLYKEQPADVLTFNAQNVLDDLKQLGYYQSDSKLEASEIKEIK